MAKILIETYGCTLNQADSRIMAGILRSKGNSVDLGSYSDKEAQSSNSDYDYVIVNTCTVKTPTEQKILSKLSTMRNLGNRLIVAGCLASASPEKVEKTGTKCEHNKYNLNCKHSRSYRERRKGK